MSLLEVRGLRVNYGSAEAVRDVSLQVGAGQVVSLIGANGAGKSTTLKGIMGLLSPAKGSVRFADRDITGSSPDRITRAGMSLVPEGRRVFGRLTVAENLDVAASAGKAGRVELKNVTDEVYTTFPRLRERRDQMSWTLSGGEQQMLAIGRALIARPRLMLLDEPSLGLAPKLAEDVVRMASRYSREHGLSVLLVEQNALLALQNSDLGFVMETGRIVAEGPAASLLQDPQVRAAYLGA